MEAFQEVNRVRVELIGRVGVSEGRSGLQFLVKAFDATPGSMVHEPLVSVNVILGSGRHQTMAGAIIWALYQLDADLARLLLGDKGLTK